MSAFGLPGVTGVLVLEVPTGSVLAKAGLQKNDVILSVNADKTADAATLFRQAPALTAGQTVKVGISRTQKEITLSITP
jgi:S1-C subfamily serine protease